MADQKNKEGVIEYIRQNRHKGGASGFILPDGEWIPIERQSHDRLISRAYRQAGEPAYWDTTSHFRDDYGVIRVTYHSGMIAFDVPDGVTRKQVEAAALRVVATAKDSDFIGWHKEPTKHYHESGPEAEERERCVAEVARLAGRPRWPKSIGARVAKSG